MTLCVIIKKFNFNLTLSQEFYVTVIVGGVCLVIIDLFMLCCIFSTVHRLIRPLRTLIDSM